MPHNNDSECNPLVVHFGSELRYYRNRAELSMQQLADALGCTPQWIGQVELAKKPPSEQFARDLDTYFQTDGTFHRIWKDYKKDGRRPILLPGFPQYLEAEAKAVGIRCFVTQVVPGLLQTEDYARAVISTWPSSEPVEARVATRMEQQQVLTRENPPDTLFVLDEAVLRRPFGGPKTMREQLAALARFIESVHIQVHILPFSAPTYAGLDGKFTMLTLGDGTEVLYQEGLGFSQVIDDHDTVREASVRFDRLLGEALPRRESQRMFLQTREGLE